MGESELQPSLVRPPVYGFNSHHFVPIWGTCILMRLGLGFSFVNTGEIGSIFRLPVHTFVPTCVLEPLFLLIKHQ